MAQIPDQLGSREGNSNDANLRALQQGGVVQLQQVVLIDAKEIVRCTALAIRRRMEILGPAGEHDELTSELVTALSRRPAAPNNWSQVWIGVQLGLAQACKGKTKEAVGELTNSLLMAGMDHNLTSTVFLELGKLAFRAQDYASAGGFFLEATYSAAVLSEDDYTQYDIMAEAFYWAMITHWATGKQEFFHRWRPPLIGLNAGREFWSHRSSCRRRKTMPR